MSNTILLSIHEHLPKMSTTEQRLGQFMLDHLEQVPQLSVSELAQQSRVSQATVVRFAKHLGLDGYKTLKVELARASNGNAALYDEVSPKDSLNVIKAKMALRIQRTIETTNEQLTTHRISSAVRLLRDAQILHVYGLGASDLVAQDITQKFLRVGKVVINTSDTHQMAVNLLIKNSEQVLFLVSHSGRTVETVKLAELAVSQGIPVIALTTDVRSPLAKYAQVVLISDGSENRLQVRSAATTSLVSQLYVVDLVYYHYLQKDYQVNAKKLTDSSETIDQLFHSHNRRD